jgi:hypothetical protein
MIDDDLGASPRSQAGSHCDIAPTRFERFECDGYFTLDADWIVPALCRAVKVEGLILEPCAGRGHMVYALRALGFTVRAADLYPYEAPLVPDITVGAPTSSNCSRSPAITSSLRICPCSAADACSAHFDPHRPFTVMRPCGMLTFRAQTVYGVRKSNMEPQYGSGRCRSKETVCCQASGPD